MSRTPLFRMLRRSYRVASYAITHVEPLDEVLDRRDSAADTVARNRLAGLTRREFVAGTTAVAAVAALDACAPARPPVVSPRAAEGGPPVLIIGAGVAGLTAGYRLHQAGIPVRIIEAQNRVGGRMYSLRNFFADGQVCELGGELIDTNHERIQKLATELGIELDDLSRDDPSLAHDTFYFDGSLRRERDVITEFVPIAGRVIAAIQPLGANPDVTFTAPHTDALALDRISITQWLDSTGVGGWFRKLLDVVYTTEHGLACSLRLGSSSSTAVSPHVLLTIPFTLLRDVRMGVELPDAKRRAIAQLGYGTNAKLMIGFSNRVWRVRQRSNGSVLTDLPFQLTWETSRLQSGGAGILTNFSAGAQGVEVGQGSAAEQAARLVADLEKVFPGVMAARAGMKVVRFHWPSFPWTRGSYASAEARGTRIGDARRSAPRRLMMATA